MFQQFLAGRMQVASSMVKVMVDHGDCTDLNTFPYKVNRVRREEQSLRVGWERQFWVSGGVRHPGVLPGHFVVSENFSIAWRSKVSRLCGG